MPSDEEQSKREQLVRMLDDAETDDSEEDMIGKSREERDKILEASGSSRARFEVVRRRTRAKLAERYEELKAQKQPSAPAPKPSNVIDLATYRRRMAASVLAAVAIAAAVFGLYLKGTDQEIAHIPTAQPPTTAASMGEAEELRMKAYERCFSQDFHTCLVELDRARDLDQGNDGPESVRNAREYARAQMEKSPSP